MSKKNIVVLAISFLAVAAFYFYLYSDSFRKQHIQISHTIRPTAAALAQAPKDGESEANRVIIFGLEHALPLTSVKVLSVSELATNKYAHPLWELVTSSNSVPTKAFMYGVGIRGMHPAVKGAKAAPLDLNVPYRVIIESGGINGQHDFSITEDDHVSH